MGNSPDVCSLVGNPSQRLLGTPSSFPALIQMLVRRQIALLDVFLQLPENKLPGPSSVTVPRDVHLLERVGRLS